MVARSWNYEGEPLLASMTVQCTGSYQIGPDNGLVSPHGVESQDYFSPDKIKLELPEAFDETKVRRTKEKYNLDHLQSSSDSVSDGDDSKECKAAQDDKNLA
jgi:hypothetical protein